jgi:predicted nucleic acid-binding protein
MVLLADTSAWSLLLRRDTPPDIPEVSALRAALGGHEAVATTGLILQELLQGFVPRGVQDAITERFGALLYLDPTREDHVAAAVLSNICRRKGVQLTTVDALIGQLCIAHDLVLLTTDADFRHAAQHVPVRVWSP